MHTSTNRIACLIAAAAAVSAPALTPALAGDWTATNLNPAGWNSAHIYSVTDGIPVGQLSAGPFNMAGYWPAATAASWVHLTPTGATSSGAYGGSSLYQAGITYIDGNYRASRWSGSSASWLDITPAGAGYSSAWGMDGHNPVGSVSIDGDGHASLWVGAAAAWVDLHPAGATTSSAFGGGGGQQVGYVSYGGGVWNAALWSGSADSFVNLHPASVPGITRSTVDAADGVQQVGEVTIDGDNNAALWSGSAESFVNLHPAGMISSTLNDVFAGWQVGYVRTSPSHFTASLWNSTAESWFDLGSVLGPEYSTSIASTVWTDGVTLYIGGSARVAGTDDYHAMLWTRTIPAPGAAGLLAVGGIFASRRRGPAAASAVPQLPAGTIRQSRRIA